MDSILREVKARLGGRSPRRVREPEAWEAAVGLILAPGSSGLDLLFIRRAERAGDPWSGQMALPGGRRDAEDVALIDTACRETLEETGISLPASSLLGELDDLFPDIKVLPPVVVRPFVFGLSTRPRIEPSDEVAGHLWVSLQTLRASASVTEVEVRGQRLTVDAYVVGEYVIWGMTQRIVAPFLERIG